MKKLGQKLILSYAVLVLVSILMVAVPVLDTPFVPDNAPVMFGDLVQVLDFDTVEDAANYPTSKAHTDLAAMSTAMLKKVTAIDYQM